MTQRPRPTRPERRRDASPAEFAAEQRLRAAQTRTRADQEREALLQSIADYIDRERTATHRLAEQSALLQLAPDPIFARDARRRITFWNAAASATYGYAADEAIGRQAGELLKTEYPIPLEEIEQLVEDEGFWEGDLVQTSRDGRRMTVASRWGAMYDENGKLSALLEINRDITDRLAAEAEQEQARALLQRERMSERLVRAQRLESLGQMAGGIAHDFNNLLAVVLGYTTVGMRHLERLGPQADPGAVASLRDDLSEIADAAERAGALTRQLLAFARQDRVTPTIIDVNATVGEMLVLLRRTLGSHIELETRLGDGVPAVRIDSGQLSQILVNLAVNSRAAMPDGGRLLVETSTAVFTQAQPLSHGIVAPGRYLRLRVNDTGTGMSQEVVERAFDPFFTTKPVGEGTGLGLATVYGIVSQAGGQVELYSEIGHGTTVTLVLPSAEDRDTKVAVSTAPPPPVVEGAQILLVDDQPALRRVLVEVLREAGYHVLEAEDGKQALRAVAEADGPIDLLLTDIVMPGMLGQQVAERVLERDPRCRVVFMSGFANPLVETEGRPLAGPLLQKPFTEQELLALIAEQLGG